MSAGIPNPFLTKTDPCWCQSGQPFKDCCGPRIPVQLASNLNPQLAGSLPAGTAYANYLNSTIKSIMRKMFPRHNDRLAPYVISFENGTSTYQAVILALKPNDETERRLLAGAECATFELALEDLSAVMYQRYRSFKGRPWDRQAWIQSLRDGGAGLSGLVNSGGF